MDLLFWGLTIGLTGKVVLGIAVLRVHMGILHEHRIDGAVLRAIEREQLVTYAALALILIGYVLEIAFYEHTPLCIGECATMLEAVR